MRRAGAKSSGLKSPESAAGPTHPTMGHSFVPHDPFQGVLQICSDLQKSGLSFSIALKIEGSVDFSVSSGHVSAAGRRGAEGASRGPSYTRRQIKRLMQRQTVQQTPRSISPETEGGVESRGSGDSDRISSSVETQRSAKIKASESENKRQASEVELTPDTSVVKKDEDGWKQKADEKKLKWLSRKMASSSEQIKKLQERVDLQGKVQRANMRLISVYVTRLGKRENGSSDDEDESRTQTTDSVRRRFGYPDEETMRRLLEHDTQQQFDPVNNNYDHVNCPNCLNPMSATHTCDDDYDIYE